MVSPMLLDQIAFVFLAFCIVMLFLFVVIAAWNLWDVPLSSVDFDLQFRHIMFAATSPFTRGSLIYDFADGLDHACAAPLLIKPR